MSKVTADGVTPRDVVRTDGCSRLLRFRPAPSRPGALPVLLVPSMLQRWYVLDLAPGASVVAGLLAAGLDVFCLDWGPLGDAEPRLGWEDALDRLRRARRVVSRLTGASVSLVGYSQGGTLAAISAARDPGGVAALVNVAGPVDFSLGGTFGALTDARWCDADALAAAGGLPPGTMRWMVAAQSPLKALRGAIGALAHPDPIARGRYAAIERWADDPVGVPPDVLAVWLGALYQRNELVRGVHRVGGVTVDLGAIVAPTLVATLVGDTVCPPEATRALLDHVGAEVREALVASGGHVSGVVGPDAPAALYGPLASWLLRHARPASARLSA